jgi:hypothetical protein
MLKHGPLRKEIIYLLPHPDSILAFFPGSSLL